MNNKLNISGAYGSADTDIKKIYIKNDQYGPSKVYVELNNGDFQEIAKPASVTANEFGQSIQEFLMANNLGPATEGINWDWDFENGNKIDFGVFDQRIIDQETAKAAEAALAAKSIKTKNLKLALGASGLAATAGVVVGIAIGSHFFGQKAADLPPVDKPTETVSTEVEEEPVVEEVSAGVSDEAAEAQKEWYNDLEEDTESFNQYLSKYYASPIIAEYKDDLEKIGVTLDETKDYANLAFTPEEVFAAKLRWGEEIENEDLINIFHGEAADLEKIVNNSKSYSNGFEERLIIAALLEKDPAGLDKLAENMEKVFGENAKEFNQFISLQKEFNELEKDGKEKEAHEKAKEMKIAFDNYTKGDTSENSRIFGLTTVTWGSVWSIQSQMHQFRDQVSYVFHDANTGKEVEYKYETNTFDEIFMRYRILGFEDCSTMNTDGSYAATIENVPTNYEYIIDEPKSLSDLAISYEVSMLESYNDYYLPTLVNENALMDSNESSSEEFRATNSRYDQLTQGTLSVKELLSEITQKLEEKGLLPANLGYYNLLINQKFKEIYDKIAEAKATANGNRAGVFANAKPGDRVSLGETFGPELIGDIAGVEMKDGSEFNPDEAKGAWEDSQEDGHDVTGKDGNWDPEKEKKVDEQEEKEAEEEGLEASQVYAAAFNYAVGPEFADHYMSTGYSYDPAWLSSSKPEIAAAASLGLEDGYKSREKYMQQGERIVEESSSGEIHDEEEYQSPITSEEPEQVNEEQPVTGEEVVDTYTPEEIAEIVGQLGEEFDNLEEQQNQMVKSM